MNNDQLDTELREMFTGEAPYNDKQHKQMMKEVTIMYKTKTRRAKYLAWGCLASTTGIILLCVWQFMQTNDIKTMLLMTILILIFHEATVLMKLWWWTYSSRNMTMETLKEIQVQLAELQSTTKQ